MRPLLTSVLSMVIVTGLAWSTAAHAERREPVRNERRRDAGDVHERR